MGSFSLGSPIVDFFTVKTRLGTGDPRSPESDAPKCSLYAPLHFPRNQPVPATYSGQYFLSLSPLPPPELITCFGCACTCTEFEVRTDPFFADLTCIESKVFM
jgi:hypothetical protein